MTYGYTREINLPFTETIARLKSVLAEAGFGVPVEMNAQAILKNKIDKDIGPYYILGACHPASAYQVIQAEKEIGLLLPCNILIYEEAGRIFVSTILPTAAMQMVDNPNIGPIAKEVEIKLRAVVDKV